MVPNGQHRRRAPQVGGDPAAVEHRRYYDSDGGAAKSPYLKSDRRSVGRERRKRAYLLVSVALLTTALILLVTAGDKTEGVRMRAIRARRGLMSQAKAAKERKKRKQRDEAARKARGMGYGSGAGAHDDDPVAESDGGEEEAATAAMAILRSPSGRYRWADPRVLPPLPSSDMAAVRPKALDMDDRTLHRISQDRAVFKVHHPPKKPMEWEIEQDEAEAKAKQDAGESNRPRERMGPKVDYTKWEYTYLDVHDYSHPPLDGSYPKLDTLGGLLKKWPQDDIDAPPSPIQEALVRFDFMNPREMESALRYREAELPFKVYNVPEVIKAGETWTDEYVAAHFDKDKRGVLKKIYAAVLGGGNGGAAANDDKEKERALAAADHVPRSKGHAQESSDSFFAFFQPLHWDVRTMGPPPTLDNDLTYERWAKHARYADRVGLAPSSPHYYFQAGVPREERLSSRDTWTFVSRDLPSLSNPKPTFFGFNPPEQKGIQCRFGERGVTAATHYDAGRNMIAMITGAKRYVLGPPKACGELGIETTKRHPTFRHSLLNFAHLNLLDDDGDEEGDEPAGDDEDAKSMPDPEREDAKSMPDAEREWLKVARDSQAVETVLKAGEVLYVPSHWFHYITSLQKSAQCNTRSGREKEGTEAFGGYRDVVKCVGEGA